METVRESQLVPEAREFLSRHMGFSGHLIFSEVRSPWGRPDLVAVRPDPLHYPGPGPMGRRTLSLISLLETGGPMGLAELADRLGMSHLAVAELISPALAGSLVQFDGENLSLRPRAMEPLTHICAVEIKICDWRTGLKQAFRHKTFADEVYVFLRDLLGRTDLDAFRRSKIGLVHLRSQPRLLVRAKRTTGENVWLCRRIVEANIGRLAQSATKMHSADTQCSF